MSDFDWFDKRLKYITESQIFKRINDGTQYVTTFTIGEWTVIKELFLAYYAPAYITILKKQGKSLNYVDLFAGSGVVNLSGLNINFPGSPLVASSLIKKQFDAYYFADIEKDKIDQLKVFLMGNNYHFYAEDANKVIGNLVKEIGQDDMHSLIFIDPKAMEIRFDSIRALKDVGCDLIVTFSSEEISRALMQWHENPTWNTEALDQFYGDANWKTEIDWSNIEFSSLNSYVKRVFKYADKTKASRLQVEKTIGGHHYYVILISTRGSHQGPSFHKILNDFNNRITSIDGKYVKKFMYLYIVGNGKPIDKW